MLFYKKNIQYLVIRFYKLYNGIDVTLYAIIYISIRTTANYDSFSRCWGRIRCCYKAAAVQDDSQAAAANRLKQKI